jgi:hypothetical protein
VARARGPALGHAVVSPPVVRSATLPVFTLSVPTERVNIFESSPLTAVVPALMALLGFGLPTMIASSCSRSG